MVHEARGHQARLLQIGLLCVGFELGAALAMGNRDGQLRAGHTPQKHRRALLNSQKRQAGFELLRAIAYEARPVLRARDDLLQVGKRLASIAHPEREGVGPREEALEDGARPGVKQNRFGPAFARAQHVAVGEPAAGSQPAERFQVEATAQDVAHVHIHRFEARTVKSRGHFDLAVHTLLTQDGHTWPGAPTDKGCCQILIWVERQAKRNTRIRLVAAGLMLLAGAARIVTQGLHGKGGLGPHPTQVGAGVLDQSLIAAAEDHALARKRAPEGVDVPGRTCEGRTYRGRVRLAHLNHGA